MDEENKKLEEVETNVDVIEFNLDDQEIDSLIAKLCMLKQTHEDISVEIDAENELLIHYDDGEDEENEELIGDNQNA